MNERYLLFLFEPMTDADARGVLSWRYEGPYAFYNVNFTDEVSEVKEMLDGSHYSARLDDGELVGFWAVGPTAQVPGGQRLGLYCGDALDIGLGLRPDFTGKGLGLSFVMAGLEQTERLFHPTAFRLSVATFNEPAVRVYERAGFQRGPSFLSPSYGGGETEFLLMKKPNRNSS